MSGIRNVLFIMYDQLRHDFLSCAGHPIMLTPNMDRLAAMGVRFSRAYVQSPVCGASRMSFYTGRYVHSHSAAWNNPGASCPPREIPSTSCSTGSGRSPRGGTEATIAARHFSSVP